MTTKEYIIKYKLNASNKFNHDEFIEDLLLDLMTLLEVGKSPTKGLNIKGFDNAVNALRQKWNAIHNKTVDGGLPEKLWGYFYATKVVKMKEKLFPEQMEARKREREERARFREERRREYDEMAGDFFDRFFYNAIFASLFSRRACPIDSFTTLGLASTATEDEVKTAFRQLSHQHHPDKGGDKEKFIAITEAKNKCLVYLSKTTT